MAPTNGSAGPTAPHNHGAPKAPRLTICPLQSWRSERSGAGRSGAGRGLGGRKGRAVPVQVLMWLRRWPSFPGKEEAVGGFGRGAVFAVSASVSLCEWTGMALLVGCWRGLPFGPRLFWPRKPLPLPRFRGGPWGPTVLLSRLPVPCTFHAPFSIHPLKKTQVPQRPVPRFWGRCMQSMVDSALSLDDRDHLAVATRSPGGRLVACLWNGCRSSYCVQGFAMGTRDAQPADIFLGFRELG